MKIQLEFSAQDEERIRDLKQLTGTAEDAELLRKALTILEWTVREFVKRRAAVSVENQALDIYSLRDLVFEKIAAIPLRVENPHLFLCHSHRDKRFARELARSLSELSIDVWFDEWELKPGDSLHGCIGSALRTSSFVAVVLSPDSVSSQWCQSELREALAREKKTGKKVVLPLLYRRVEAPPFLEDRLYIDFRRSHLSGLAQLAGIIHNIDPRSLTEELARRRPSTLDELKTLLKACGWQGARSLNYADYETVRQILRKIGLSPFGEEFDIILKWPGLRAMRSTVSA